MALGRGKLIGVIGDEDTCVGFLLGGGLLAYLIESRGARHYIDDLDLTLRMKKCCIYCIMSKMSFTINIKLRIILTARLLSLQLEY